MKDLLIVEDNEHIRKLYSILIGYKLTDAKTTFAKDGKEGLEACKKSEPGLILCDIRMPVMDGIEFHRQLKEEAPHLADRIGFISAGFKNSHLEYMKANNCRYLEKPFEAGLFHRFIESMLATGDGQSDIQG